jgi:hypothetical protein
VALANETDLLNEFDLDIRLSLPVAGKGQGDVGAHAPGVHPEEDEDTDGCDDTDGCGGTDGCGVTDDCGTADCETADCETADCETADCETHGCGETVTCYCAHTDTCTETCVIEARCFPYSERPCA